MYLLGRGWPCMCAALWRERGEGTVRAGGGLGGIGSGERTDVICFGSTSVSITKYHLLTFRIYW